VLRSIRDSIPLSRAELRDAVNTPLADLSPMGKFLRYGMVGGASAVVDFSIYAGFLALGLHYLVAAVGSFLVAVVNNYWWNRHWTFRVERGHLGAQGLRFLVVSTLSLVANLVVLHTLVQLGLGEILAQAIAIVFVTPLNFVGNKIWSFRR